MALLPQTSQLKYSRTQPTKPSNRREKWYYITLLAACLDDTMIICLCEATCIRRCACYSVQHFLGPFQSYYPRRIAFIIFLRQYRILHKKLCRPTQQLGLIVQEIQTMFLANTALLDPSYECELAYEKCRKFRQQVCKRRLTNGEQVIRNWSTGYKRRFLLV